MSEGEQRSYGVTPKKTWPMNNTRDLIKKKKIQVDIRGFSNSLSHFGETPMTGFHTWHCRYEGVSQDSGYGHEKSHLMHDT